MRGSARTALLVAATLLAGAATVRAQGPDRSAPPEPGPPPRLVLPEVQRFELSNGLPVVLLEKHDVPLVQVNLMVEAGAVDEPMDRLGLAGIHASMMDEGAGDLDALGLADAIEFLGASLTVGSGRHTTVVALHAPVVRLGDVLPLMADVARRPSFPTDELERLRISRLTAILQQHDQPNVIAGTAFVHALYGETHPYGRPIQGTPATIKALSVDDLRAFHRRWFHAANATLIVTGDVQSARLIEQLEAVFGDWAVGDRERPAIPAPGQVAGRRVVLVDRPEAEQSTIYLGRIGAPRVTDDYYALEVMNTVLGGAFSSRLNKNLREDKGYTYGAFSAFLFRPESGPFIALAAVQTDVTDPSLTGFIAELERIRDGVTEEELARARNYVALGLPGDFQTVAGVAGKLSDLVLYDLPSDYYNHYVDHVLAVTREDVRRVAQDYVDPDTVVIIVVGDLTRIEDGVRALDLGPVDVLSIEDVLGPKPDLSANR